MFFWWTPRFCLLRNETNPVLSVRYKESYNWGGWQIVTAGALTAGDKTIPGAWTATGNITCSRITCNISVVDLYVSCGDSS